MENWFKIEFIFAKNLHITPHDLDNMEFYRIEYMIENYEEFIEEENKNYKKQERDQEKQFSKNKPPATGDFKVPKMKVPDIKVPKF